MYISSSIFCFYINRSDDTSCQGEEVLDILDRITVDIEQLRDAETDLKPPDGLFISVLFCLFPTN